MIDTVKKFNIFDTSGNCYKVDERNNLVVAKDTLDAATFTFWEANQRIGNGRRSHFYKILEADDTPASTAIVTSASSQKSETADNDCFSNPTKYDELHNDWESILSELCYMSDHIKDYQDNLNKMLSDVDKEISDILHYLEFTDLSDSDILTISRRLQECRRHRRKIKDEIDKTDSIRSVFLDKSFGNKVRQSLAMIKKIETRQYTPRKLYDLFNRQ